MSNIVQYLVATVNTIENVPELADEIIYAGFPCGSDLAMALKFYATCRDPARRGYTVRHALLTKTTIDLAGNVLEVETVLSVSKKRPWVSSDDKTWFIADEDLLASREGCDPESTDEDSEEQQ